VRFHSLGSLVPTRRQIHPRILCPSPHRPWSWSWSCGRCFLQLLPTVVSSSSSSTAWLPFSIEGDHLYPLLNHAPCQIRVPQSKPLPLPCGRASAPRARETGSCQGDSERGAGGGCQQIGRMIRRQICLRSHEARFCHRSLQTGPNLFLLPRESSACVRRLVILPSSDPLCASGWDPISSWIA